MATTTAVRRGRPHVFIEVPEADDPGVVSGLDATRFVIIDLCGGQRFVQKNHFVDRAGQTLILIIPANRSDVCPSSLVQGPPGVPTVA